VTALDVALMGTLSRVPWWRPLGRRERSFGLDALERVGLRDLAKEQFGELSGVQQPSADLLERLLDELGDEGRGVLIATHDLEQARRWDRVLCLNRRQIAFG